MSAFSTLGQRQQLLLKALLQRRGGLTVDELADQLKISRNAVNQHLSSLESSGFITNSGLSGNRGRPSKLYSLTPAGLELFPRHYALFANLLIDWIRQRHGPQELENCLTQLGRTLAGEFTDRVHKHAGFADKVNEVAVVMHELGYAAEAVQRSNNDNEIVATNCVFHQLASDCHEVCQLDLSLMSHLLDAKIEHRECMVRGGQCCRFGIQKKKRSA